MGLTMSRNDWLDRLLIRTCDLTFGVATAVFYLPLGILLSVAIMLAWGWLPFEQSEAVNRAGQRLRLKRFHIGPSESNPLARYLRQFLEGSRLVGLPCLWDIIVGDLSLVGGPPGLAIAGGKPGLLPAMAPSSTAPRLAAYLISLGRGVARFFVA